MTTSIYRIDINIVDDHSLLTESLADAINRSNVAHVSRTFSTLETCRQTLEERCPDVLLLDISMPDGNGIAFCRQMLGLHPKLKIICITIHDEYSVIHRMMDTGVHGYLLKSSPISELIEAIQTVWKGGYYQQVRTRYCVPVECGAQYPQTYLRGLHQSRDSIPTQSQHGDRQLVSQATAGQVRREEHRQPGYVSSEETNTS